MFSSGLTDVFSLGCVYLHALELHESRTLEGLRGPARMDRASRPARLGRSDIAMTWWLLEAGPWVLETGASGLLLKRLFLGPVRICPPTSFLPLLMLSS